MPYFKWYALDTQGTVHSGVDFARSPEILTKRIKRKDFVEVVSCEEYNKPIFSPISYAQRALFFRQLGSLLQAGIRVADALKVAEQTVSNQHFQRVVADCLYAVQEGISLSQACSYHRDFFTPFACRLLMAGEESGALATACNELANYYENIELFVQKVRSVILLPIVTLLFFFVIITILFVTVIPRFAVLLQSLNKPLPKRTEFLIQLSSWIKSINAIPVIVTIGICLLLMRWMNVRAKRRATTGAWLLYIPYIRLWVVYAAAISFFKTLGSLLIGGVDIAKALSIASLGISAAPLRTQYEACTRFVEAGIPLSQALQRANIRVASSCHALIHVGEATGNLGPLLLQCATYYQEKLYKMLHTFSQVVQPVLLLFLGVLVACLIFILYEPIFTLSMIAA